MDLILRFDFAVLDFIQAYLKNPVTNKLMLFFTHLGDSGLIWIAISVIFLLTKKYRKSGLTAGLALFIGFIVCNLIMKNAFARTRPYCFNDDITLLISAPKDFSFPSGHTCSSFAASAAMLFTMQKRFAVPAVILAFVIAFSRLYLYVHYPSDVIVGAAIGILSAASAVKIISAVSRQKQHSKRGSV